jgi:dGTP triphosphohydrolase
VVKEYVSAHIDDCLKNVDAHDLSGLDDKPGRYRRKLDLKSKTVKKVETLKSIVFNTVIRTSPVYTLQHAGVKMIEDIFTALTNVKNPNLIYLFPLDLRTAAQEAVRSSEEATDLPRIFELVRDYIASMTDSYCEALWRRMFSPGGGLFTARA